MPILCTATPRPLSATFEAWERRCRGIASLGPSACRLRYKHVRTSRLIPGRTGRVPAWAQGRQRSQTIGRTSALTSFQASIWLETPRAWARPPTGGSARGYDDHRHSPGPTNMNAVPIGPAMTGPLHNESPRVQTKENADHDRQQPDTEEDSRNSSKDLDTRMRPPTCGNGSGTRLYPMLRLRHPEL